MGKNYSFSVSTYLFAGGLEKASLDEIRRGIVFFERFCPLDKVYIEPHRGGTDVNPEKVLAVKQLFAEYGIETAGGITTTILPKQNGKNIIFDTFCFSERQGRKRLVEIVKNTARLFDEVILDDFYFTACRCGHCIEAKGGKSWAEYRLALMEDVSEEIASAAREVNPDVKFIIKFPNWYEAYQETGYNPEKQKDIFDGLFTGTETRNPKYEQQHLQRYLSYSILRYMENVSPGRNGGGWIDPFGLADDISGWIEQAEFTLFAKAKELMLFNFFAMTDTGFLPPLTPRLNRLNMIIPDCGKPTGARLYEPYNADGEDQLVTYLGMTGIAFEPSPVFNGGETETVFLPQSAAYDKAVMPKLEKHVREGGTAVITTGFLKACLDIGIKDMTSARPTGRRATGHEYWIQGYGEARTVAYGVKPVLLEAIDYKTNASWCEAALMTEFNSFPILIHDFYGKGHLYILNMPDEFGDVCSLPKEVTGFIAKVFAGNGPYIQAAPRVCAFTYDNGVIGVYSQKAYADEVEVFIPGDCVKLCDLETGAELPLHDAQSYPRNAAQGNAARYKSAKVYLDGGSYKFFRMTH
jgi:hypothetical protein